jgi:hypothetical protein
MPGTGPRVGVGRRRRALLGGGAPLWSWNDLGNDLAGFMVSADGALDGSSFMAVPSRGLGMGFRASSAAASPDKSGDLLTFVAANNDNLSQPPAVLTGALTFVSAQEVPDGSGEDAGRGFTCTGAVAEPGTSPLIIWMGNDGRKRGGSTFAASVVRVRRNADGSLTKLAEYTLASLGLPTDSSVQGVAYIPASVTGGVNELWFVRTAGATRQVHRINADTGALLSNPWGGATFTALNALAYDSEADALIVGDGGTALAWHSRTAANTSAPLRTMTASLDVDQIAYDPVRKAVAMSGGPNAADGLVRFRNALNAPNTDYVQMTAPGTLSIEGIVITATEILLLNDGYFHGSTSEFNELRAYTLPAALPAHPQSFRTGSRVQLFGIARIPATPGSAQCIMQFGGGDPTTGTATGSGGIYASNTAGRLTLFQNAANLSFSGLALSSEFLFFADIDLATDTGSLWFNGVLQGAQGQAFSASPATNMVPRAQVRVGLSSSRPFSGEVIAAGASFGTIGITERQKIEGRMAHDTGRTALLPGGHPYKTSPP